MNGAPAKILFLQQCTIIKLPKLFSTVMIIKTRLAQNKSSPFIPCLQQYTMHIHFLFLLILFLLISLSFSDDRPEAYISLLYGNTYLLPLRVMMRSLYHVSPDIQSNLRQRLVMVTKTTSSHSIQQLKDDNLTVLQVPTLDTPYTSNPKFQNRFRQIMTKLTIFNLTQYSRLIFIDADSLVLKEISPLFKCGHFCVTFINPCNFNAGFMVVSPNATRFSSMIAAFNSTISYDGGDQGFLNAFLPSLHSAPLFDPNNPPQKLPLFSRLPFNWHVDHSSYFPTFNFAFSTAPACGPARLIEWLGPPLFKPWWWFTYAFLDLSWLWHSHRKQLDNPYPSDHPVLTNTLILLLTSAALLASLEYAFNNSSPLPLPLTFLSRITFFPVRNSLHNVIPVLLGILLWIAGFIFSVTLIPTILAPYLAIALFFVVRLAITMSLLTIIGLVGGVTMKKHQVLLADKIKTVYNRMKYWSLLDSAWFIVFFAVLWRVPVQNMWQKGTVIVVAILIQMAIVCCMLTDVVEMWRQVVYTHDGKEDTP